MVCAGSHGGPTEGQSSRPPAKRSLSPRRVDASELQGHASLGERQDEHRVWTPVLWGRGKGGAILSVHCFLFSVFLGILPFLVLMQESKQARRKLRVSLGSRVSGLGSFWGLALFRVWGLGLCAVVQDLFLGLRVTLSPSPQFPMNCTKAFLVPSTRGRWSLILGVPVSFLEGAANIGV